MSEYETDWEDWFASESLDPVRITYDQLSADPGAVLGDILDHLGLDREIARGIAPPVAKLADAISRDWAGRFRGMRR